MHANVRVGGILDMCNSFLKKSPSKVLSLSSPSPHLASYHVPASFKGRACDRVGCPLEVLKRVWKRRVLWCETGLCWEELRKRRDG